MKTKILAWHFAGADRVLGYGDGRIINPGRVYRVEGRLVICQKGLHGSVSILDALAFAKGPVLSRVELRGECIAGSRKVCARERKHLVVADVTRGLHLFALACAERALKRAGNPDPRSVEALRVKRRWIDGKATDEGLSVARQAARAAAEEAAAEGAAWAAEEAAEAAARAAEEAAEAAAEGAAWAAEEGAAWAAEEAERKWQEKTLLRLLRTRHPKLFKFG